MTGPDLRMLREQLLITRNALAREAGVQRATVQSAERSRKLNAANEQRYLDCLGRLSRQAVADRRREAIARMLATVDDVLLDLSSTITV